MDRQPKKNITVASLRWQRRSRWSWEVLHGENSCCFLWGNHPILLMNMVKIWRLNDDLWVFNEIHWDLMMIFHGDSYGIFSGTKNNWNWKKMFFFHGDLGPLLHSNIVETVYVAWLCSDHILLGHHGHSHYKTNPYVPYFSGLHPMGLNYHYIFPWHIPIVQQVVQYPLFQNLLYIPIWCLIRGIIPEWPIYSDWWTIENLSKYTY